MGDIINLKSRRKEQEEGSVDLVQASVTDITNLREQQIDEDRREAKRTILDGFVGASVVVPGRGLLKVSIFDISKGGLSFDVDSESGHFHDQEEVAFRFYFNHKIYFPFVARITSHRHFLEEGVVRHGANFVTELSNTEALYSFIDFLEAVSSDLKMDKGDLFISGSHF